jgi:hypothetical protein
MDLGRGTLHGEIKPLMPKPDSHIGKQARDLVIKLGEYLGNRYKGVMLETIRRISGLTWREAEAAARYADKQGWVYYRLRIVVLTENGRSLCHLELRAASGAKRGKRRRGSRQSDNKLVGKRVAPYWQGRRV